MGAMADAAALPGARPGDDAMGLYVGGRKLGSVGIRVSGGITSHGLALNRDPDLEWFRLMTACGAPGVEATSIAAEGGDPRRERVEADLAEALAERLGCASRRPRWRTCCPPRRLSGQDSGQEAPRALLLRGREHLRGEALLHDHPLVHEQQRGRTPRARTPSRG